MKKYNLTVNGKDFEVVVNSVDGVAAPVAAAPVAAAPAPAAKPAAAPAPAAKPAAAPVAAGAGAVIAPIPGLIKSVKVKVGDTVAVGDCVVVMEAMKMENDINSEVAGTVSKVVVTEGQNVQQDEQLVIIG